MADNAPHRVVIIGGGFGGLNAALHLHRSTVEVTLVDKRNFHLFQPLLYQVATGSLSPANIASPLRSILRRNKRVRTVLGEVTGFDLTAKHVLVGEEKLPFDSLILAAGATNNYFAHPEWEKYAPGLKTIEEATDIRRQVLHAFEAAELTDSPKFRERLMTFVIVGGGATGVEMAGSISELSRMTLRDDFRRINPGKARIILVEGGDRVLGNMPESLSKAAQRSLTKMGVELWLSSRVKDIQDDHVIVEQHGTTHQIDATVTIWAAGVKGSPLGRMLADATGSTVDRAGRVQVEPDNSLRGHPNIFVIGDLATMKDKDGHQLPGVAQVAMQQGTYVAKLIQRRLDGQAHPGAFRYWDKGNMATIGRNSAVVDAHFIRFSGWFAWLAWLFIHIAFLIQFQNRILVMMQWAYSYITRNRAARLITGNDRPK